MADGKNTLVKKQHKENSECLDWDGTEWELIGCTRREELSSKSDISTDIEAVGAEQTDIKRNELFQVKVKQVQCL